jgi:DNA modification methylase
MYQPSNPSNSIAQKLPLDRKRIKSLTAQWNGSVLNQESTLQQIGPYIGKMKSSMARALISEFTSSGQTVYDPFCGSGTVAFEAWAAGRSVIANDLNPYAVVLTKGKLFPILSVESAANEIEDAIDAIARRRANVDLRKVPIWVRSFFHTETLRETIAWCDTLRKRKSFFLISCLLGILHHQRPGFLSYPSSHSVPYLRLNNFPREQYPELYEYRTVQARLERKVKRALRRVPKLDLDLVRTVHSKNAGYFEPPRQIDAIITSPPYMRQLDYGRDNRLRLWFLGSDDWRLLDRSISPSEADFVGLLRSCFTRWKTILPKHGLCILVLGDTQSRLFQMPLHDLVAKIAADCGGFSVLWKYTEKIPNVRRVRRGYAGSETETILVLRNERAN